MELIIFIGLALFIMIDARVNLILSRGYTPRINNPIVVLINLLGAIASIAGVVWGFMHLDWWVPIVSLLGMSFVVHSMVSRFFAFFFTITPITNLIIIILTAILWFAL